MLSWLRSLPRLANGRKSTHKSRCKRPTWRTKPGHQHFRVECLEDRRLLAVDVAISQLFAPEQVSTVGSQDFSYRITNNDGAAATSGLTFTDTFTAPAGTTVFVSDSALHFLPSPNYESGSALPLTLAPGETDNVDVSFQTTQPGALVNAARVTETGDTESSNNTANPLTVTVTTVRNPGSDAFFLESDPGDGTLPTEVTNLYWNLLGRMPDTAGEQSWIAYGQAHPNAAGYQAIVSGFLNSSEYKTNYVTAVYETFLGRLPEVDGLAYWTDKMGDPGTPGGHGGSADEKDVVAAVLGSNEFYNNAGGKPQSWINALYLDVLRRPPVGDDMSFWEHELEVRGTGDRDGIARDLLSAPETAHDLLDAFYPVPGGTTTDPLPKPGEPAGTGSGLAAITGGGWENLYFGGPWNGAQEGNDVFFGALAGGASWDDVQYLMLTNPQYLNSANNPVLHQTTASLLEGDYTFGAYSGAVTFQVQEETAGATLIGEATFAKLGAATFSGTVNGNNVLTGFFSNLPNGPNQLTVTLDVTARTVAGTISGTVDGQAISGTITAA